MDLPKCKNCDYLRNAPEGICLVKPASDGLPLRCVGGWSKAKHYYLKRYIDTFTTGMRLKWKGQLYYLDLFAGPGKCRIRETEEEIDGSPLLALNSVFPFAGYFFVELEREVLNCLSKRCKSHKVHEKINFIQGDCNEKINEIINDIPSRSLSLAFIDPTGLHFKFSTLQELAKRKVDLIITFPEGMAIKRNLKKFLEQEHSLLDNVIGDREWRQFKTGREIIGYFRKKLETLEYQEVKLGDEIPIRSTIKNLPLYCLLFASKHPVGYKFWKEVGKIEYTGQRRLFD